MNTVDDILELINVGRAILARTGLVMTEVNGQFSERMKELIIRSFFLLCVDEKKRETLTRKELPSFEEMCESLKKVNQSTKLPQFAQAAYYCAIAVLLTMDGHEKETQLNQYGRADMLMNSGLLPN